MSNTRHGRRSIDIYKSQEPAEVYKGHKLKKPATNPSKSYLKERRSKARAESRNTILTFLDKNVDDLDQNEETKSGHSRLGNLFHKKKRRYDDKIKKTLRRASATGAQKAQHYQDRRPSNESTSFSSHSRSSMGDPLLLDDDELIVEGVLRRYPTDQCESFLDHKEMAEAELIANITNTSPTELRRLKIKLTEKLRKRLGVVEEDSSVNDSDHLVEVFEDNESDVTSLTSLTSVTGPPSAFSSSLDMRPKSSNTLSRPASSSFNLSHASEENIISVGGLAIMNGKYTGTICAASGKPHGKGKLVYRGSKGTYEGEWKQGRWNGKGKHLKPNGDVYEGNFLDNLYHGEGIFRYNESKRRFEGQYVMGERVKGTMRYADGSVYKGQFYHGRRHGRGCYTFKDGSRYKGDFVKDLMQGIGELRFRDGSKYVGEWKKGKQNGKGNMYSPDGVLRWAGTWRDGKQVRSDPRKAEPKLL